MISSSVRALIALPACAGMLCLLSCGESPEKAYARGYEDGTDAGYEDGYDRGHEEGREEAFECVRDEGGSAEDAADNCE